jgi:hypothetical protein
MYSPLARSQPPFAAVLRHDQATLVSASRIALARIRNTCGGRTDASAIARLRPTRGPGDTDPPGNNRQTLPNRDSPLRESIDSYWIHAYLHRKEGDLGNSNYWYRRAGRTMPECDLDQEWNQLYQSITSN